MNLRKNVLSIFDSAVGAADAREAVIEARRFFANAGENDIFAIAIGKAASPMAAGLDEIIGERLTQGIVAGILEEKVSISNKWMLFAGGHPQPNDASFEAGDAAIDLLRSADRPDALVVFLISGGGSAMIESGQNGLTRSEIIEANQTLISCGADIAEVNNIRKLYSAIKGGKLADIARRARQITLIVSDTEPGDEAKVASGPSMFSDLDKNNAIGTIQRFGLRETLSSKIIDLVESYDVHADRLKPIENAEFHVILENKTAINAAAETASTMGFAVTILDDLRQGDVGDGCDEMLKAGLERVKAEPHIPHCILSGGEFACPVVGNGVGGRNAETVLRMAIKLNESEVELTEAVFLSGGTDGIDGNSPAAGAVCDLNTVKRSDKLGLSAKKYLAASDAYSFFDSLGDAVITGPTLTNVRDIRILLLNR